MRTYDVLQFAAAGDGKTNDAASIQRAIDTAANAGGGVVVVPPGKSFLIGTIELRDHVELRLGKGATLLASDRREDYREGALVLAKGARDIAITGSGAIDGRSALFMASELSHIFRAKPWRPTMLLLEDCRGVRLEGVTLRDSPAWCVHLAGCEGVRAEGVRIDNDLKVPNCDGIDIDHCRDVIVRGCDIRAGDDCIVLKTTRRFEQYGPCQRVRVSDCALTSSSCALKIGSETVSDIRDVTFERCTIRGSNRGLGIQHRDGGDVRDITFADITVETHLFHDDWWGKSEPIYVTSLPRSDGAKLGRLSDVRFRNIACRGEAGAYLRGCEASRPRGVTLENVSMHVAKTTDRAGGMHDSRPASGGGLAPHPTAGIYAQWLDGLTVRNCTVTWGDERPDWFGHALECHQVGQLSLEGFRGDAAHPERNAARVVD